MQSEKLLNRSCNDAVERAVEWSLMHGLALKTSKSGADHCAFSFAPTPIAKERFEQLKQVTPLMGRMINAVAADYVFFV